MLTDKRTDRHDEAKGALRNFANAPEDLSVSAIWGKNRCSF